MMKKIALLLVCAMLFSLVACADAGKTEEGTTDTQTGVPTTAPSGDAPTLVPTEAPTSGVTESDTAAPTASLSESPTEGETVTPTENATVIPSEPTTEAPTSAPTAEQTNAPTVEQTNAPTASETIAPTVEPTVMPTSGATEVPTEVPTEQPTSGATEKPSEKPTEAFALLFEKNGDSSYAVVGYTGKAEHVVIPETYNDLPVTEIKAEAFDACKTLLSVELPATIQTIGEYAFRDCKKLQSITLPADILSIGSGAFYRANDLESVTYGGTKAAWKKVTLGNRNIPLTNATFTYLGLPSIHDEVEEPTQPEKPEDPMDNIIYTIIKPMTMTLSNGDTFNYRMYVPEDYDPNKFYPVLILLHGAGERGDDNASQMKNMVATLFADEDSPIHDAIFLCPQCPADNQWVDTPWADGNYSIDDVPQSNESLAVLEMLSLVRSEYNVDGDRIYLMGISMGGFGTWDLILRNPDLFAAAIPICGGGDPTKVSAIAKMPIRTFHGDADKIVPVDGTRAMVEALLAVGGNIEYEELAGYGHNVWSYAAEKEGLMDWLFMQRKGNADIEVSFGDLFGK